MSCDKGDDDMEDITAANIPDDLAPFKRDRAFSFEFFSFAGDDLLPAPPITPASAAPLPEPASSEHFQTRGRPRGDSIIFDPASFQDGGIHEKNAIIKVKAAVTKGKSRTPTLLADSRLAAPAPVPVRPQPQPPRPIAAASHPGSSLPQSVGYHASPPSGVDNGQVATLPSALSVPDANGNSTGTFQMELLNKDGRIGIYLPDARRARIARFHAKRKMRIWRKRIKYDCRKKLADSRPRIKGRFVKRSDMDD
jgi:CCT motif